MTAPTPAEEDAARALIAALGEDPDRLSIYTPGWGWVLADVRELIATRHRLAEPANVAALAAYDAANGEDRS